jgi:hypothetical protein
MATAAAVLGSNLVVVALAWDNPPAAGGMVTITFLMMIAFVAFVDVLHYLMRIDWLVSRLKLLENDEEAEGKILLELNNISKLVRFMHISGLVLTMIAFWVISYKYLVSIVDYHPIVLLLPFILFVLFWIPKFYGVEQEVSIKSRESIIQIVIQVIFLVLICLDFLRIITIF